MKLTLKAFLHYEKYDFEEKPRYSLMSFDMTSTSPSYALIKQIEVDVDIPDDFDPRPQQIAGLREKKKEVMAELQSKITNIDEQINRLLALENKS